jgi:4-hydroxy-2-oxoheptanedioate aldolase
MRATILPTLRSFLSTAISNHKEWAGIRGGGVVLAPTATQAHMAGVITDMRKNRVKQKLQAGEPTYGSWLSLGDLYATRVLARMGFDWLTLDIEHSAIDWSQATSIFGAIADAGCIPLARVPEGTHHYIKRVLDAGAWGIVVPMVDTVEQARVAIAAAKYPPTGNRSVGGGMHAMNFDASAGDYYAQANDEILVVLQTESPQGVANAEEIYALPGCDAIFIGPNDLRFQMRAPDGTFPTAEEHEAMIQQVIQAGKKVGTPTGIHAMDAESALERARQGMQFLAIGSDLRMMTVQAREILDRVRPDRVVGDVARY